MIGQCHTRGSDVGVHLGEDLLTQRGPLPKDRLRAGAAAGLAPSVYCWGDAPMLADCCLVPQVFNGKRFDVNLDGLPLTMGAFEACMALPAFQQAQPSACPDFEA